MHLHMILLFLLVSPVLQASEPADCSFSPEDKQGLEESLTCPVTPEDFKMAKSTAQGLKTIVSKMKLYPVYSKTGEFKKFVSVTGEFRKGLVLVAKEEKPIKESYPNFEDFTSYESNHYKVDLSCFASHLTAGVPSEESVLKCIDTQISVALKRHHIDEIKRFDLKKLKMIYHESTQSFDTQSGCGGDEQLTFFRGKVYNSLDFGNFVWGAIMQKLKVSDLTKKVGSEFNAYVSSGKQNKGFLKSTHILGDSPRDQVAIFDGARWIRQREKE